MVVFHENLCFSHLRKPFRFVLPMNISCCQFLDDGVNGSVTGRQAQAEEAVMEEIRESRKSIEQERVAHLPPQKNDVLESVLKVSV